MEILHINDHKVKLTLTQKEIDRLSLSGRRVEEWGDVRATLSQILKGSTLSADFLKGRILVQAYPMCDGGCELFITRLCEIEKEAAEPQPTRKRTIGQSKHKKYSNAPSTKEDEANAQKAKSASSVAHTFPSAQTAGDTSPRKRATSVFRFATREDLKEAAHLFGQSMRGSEVFHIEGDRYVLVTELRAFGNTSQDSGLRMHPLCEFAEPLPIGVLDCLSEHGCRVSLDEIISE